MKGSLESIATKRAPLIQKGAQSKTRKRSTKSNGTFTKYTACALSYLIAKTKKPIPVSIARNLEEHKRAYEVVYQEYKARKICEKNESEYFCTHYSTLPSARTFTIGNKKHPLGTLTCISDSEWGLPLEALYSEEMKALKKDKSKKFFELSLLALNSNLLPKKKRSLFSYHKLHVLYSLILGAAMYMFERTNVTDMVIVVHPRHREIYELLGFRQFGSIRKYESACGKDALPMTCSINSLLAFLERVKLRQFAQDAIAGCGTVTHHTFERYELIFDEWELRNKLPLNLQRDLLQRFYSQKYDIAAPNNITGRIYKDRTISVPQRNIHSTCEH